MCDDRVQSNDGETHRELLVHHESLETDSAGLLYLKQNASNYKNIMLVDKILRITSVMNLPIQDYCNRTSKHISIVAR